MTSPASTAPAVPEGPPAPPPAAAVKPTAWWLAPRLWMRIAVFGIVLFAQGGEARNRYSPNRWLYADGSFYYNIVRGLTQHGSLEQGDLHPHTWFNGKLGWNYNLDDAWSNIAVGRDGTWYPKHGFLMPATSIPLYLAFGPIGTLFFNVLCGAISALLAAELAASYTARWAASLIGLALGLTPVIVKQAYGFNNDVFYTTLVLATAVELANRRYARSGLWGGFSVLAKITNGMFLAAFGLQVLATRNLRSIRRFVGYACIGIGVVALANWIMFGAPWVSPYNRVLVVHNGAQEIQSHLRLFSRDFNQGYDAIWRQVKQTLPLYIVGFAGCAAFALRRRFVTALAYALCLFLPLVFFAKYSFYREEFLDPSYALCAAPLGALVGLLFRPSEGEPDLSPRVWKWSLGAVATALVVLSLGRGASALMDKTVTLSKLVPDSRVTHVFLGDIPCDYFNNQVGRWECSGFDRGQEWCFTGQTLDKFPRFGGQEKAPIDLDPNPSGQPRRIVFAPIWQSHLDFGYGIADGSPPAPVDVTVRLGEREVLHETVTAPGWHETRIDTPAGQSVPLEIDVTGPATPARLFYVDGTLGN